MGSNVVNGGAKRKSGSRAPTGVGVNRPHSIKRKITQRVHYHSCAPESKEIVTDYGKGRPQLVRKNAG